MIKLLINGQWHNAVEDTAELREIRLQQKQRWFRDWVSAAGESGFKAEPGRYHLYVSYACPWAHRTILYRALKGLQDIVSMSVLHPRWAGVNGWEFGESPMSTPDHINDKQYLYQIYQAAKPDITAKVTVPVLWDKQRETIVNNESGEIIRMFNSEFNTWADPNVDFYPPDLREDIDTLNQWLLDKVCMGVYKAGFASEQSRYDKAVRELFDALDTLEARLQQQTYLFGERLTESDWHLFATLCRFDAVYHGALKCNLKRLIDYPALSAYTHRLYQLPSVADTVKLDHVKYHYYDDLQIANPAIVPLGPAVDFRNALGVC